MKTHIILLVVLSLAIAKLCTQPQRVGLMSFAALSQRDHITTLFEKLSTKTSKYNTTTTIDGVNYTVSELQPGFYYNDNAEKNQFVDSLTANVTAGQLVMGAGLDFSYGASPATKGRAFLKGSLDSFYFTK